jgi:hypothetical protein
MLVMIPVTTSAAYNEWGGHSLYAINAPAVTQVSLDRPGSVMVGTWGPGTTRMGGWGPRWEEIFVRWLERGYTAEYCTSLDLHQDPALLAPYQLLVLVGHDEYWSKEMRDRAEAFVAGGGNIAIFSGNTCYWQVRFEDGGRTMVCARDEWDLMSGTQLASTRWDSPQVDRPENTLTGVSTRYGAIGNMGSYPAVDYTVRFPEHWVFQGTGLAKGDGFGRYTTQAGTTSIVGYECDAAHVEWQGDVPVVTGTDGTPRNFVVLANADLSGFQAQKGNATMGLYLHRGVVFTASTTNWVHGLSADFALLPAVDRITRNVLDRLSRPDAAFPAVRNPEFEALDGWIVERTGEYRPLSGEGEFPATRTAAPIATAAVAVDATEAKTWVSQFLEPLHARTHYRVSCWVRAPQGATVVVALQSTADWVDFGAVSSAGHDEWRLLNLVCKVDDRGPLFGARVRLQAEGGVAYFTRVFVERIRAGHWSEQAPG